MPPAAKNQDFLDFCLKGGPPAAKNHEFKDFGLKGVPPAAKNHDFTDLGLIGGPPAAKNHVFAVFGDNIDILSGSEVFYFFIFSTPPGGSEFKKKEFSEPLFEPQKQTPGREHVVLDQRTIDTKRKTYEMNLPTFQARRFRVCLR